MIYTPCANGPECINHVTTLTSVYNLYKCSYRCIIQTKYTTEQGQDGGTLALKLINNFVIRTVKSEILVDII